ncbi:MAG: nucleotidyltransferase domain-containing protein [Candidatus Anammoxibacter sp.]
MQYGLKEKTIREINIVFEKYEEVTEVVLYGSRAKWDFTPGSDIDFTLKGDKLSLRLINKISADLDELLLPYTFDISIYSHIDNPDLIEHIGRVGVVFYMKNASAKACMSHGKNL